ncbi:MAG: hypothetical protein EXR11_02250 [Rhodospirillaceae bacterium]|nr:hypothetical protein [Rhodospirillaceae bacterium]
MAITSESTMAEAGGKRRRKGAFSHPAGGPIAPQVLEDGLIADGADGAEAEPATASPSDLLQELIRAQEAALTAFANTTMQALGAPAANMQAFDRYGLNLYVAGAAQELAWREALTAQTMHAILTTVLTEQGTSAEVAKSFNERLDTAANRPRFKAVMEAGRAAMVASIANQPVPPTANITQIMAGWSNPHGKAAAAQRYAVLLTDIIGSADATRKLGNSGAQRMLRAHNSIVRAALKDCKGEEVKHTGDGILAVFAKPSDAADAAIAIQQDIFAFCRDNPDIPFAIRIGLEYAEGLKDEGEYFGPAFTTIASICDAAGGGDIAATEAVKAQSTGANTKYADLTPSPTAKKFLPGLFKLLWAPKRVLNAPPLEYRHIGTISTPEQKQTDDF